MPAQLYLVNKILFNELEAIKRVTFKSSGFLLKDILSGLSLRNSSSDKEIPKSRFL